MRAAYCRPTISVIIPTYNCAHYIAESIQTVLLQTQPASQILIVDDGSIDNTQTVVEQFDDRRIQYIRNPHAGVSAARNKGLDLSNGEFIAFLDADDLWRPEMLERQLRILGQRCEIVYSFTNFVRFDNESRERLAEQFSYYDELNSLPLRFCDNRGSFLIEADAFESIVRFGEIPAYTQCMLFRTDLISDLRFNESLRICEDIEFVLRASLRGRAGGTFEVLADVRRHGSNVTKDTSLMALDKLAALLSIKQLPDTPARQAALNYRLIKGHIDAASSLINHGRLSEAARVYRDALTVSGSIVQKSKGLARLLYMLAKTVG